MPPRMKVLGSVTPFLRQRRLLATQSLSGSHAIVTGASRGIGLSVARLLSAHGASLTLISRDPSRLEAAGASIAGPTSLLPGDVSDPAFWADVTLPSRVDVLVNAAGITTVGPFVRSAQSAMEDVVRTNLLGTMMACRAVGKKMMRQPKHEIASRGTIVNIASLLGVRGGAGSAAYAASKAGIVGFSRALAAEMGGAGVRVNTVLPGYVTSDMTDAMTTEARDKALSQIPLKRFGTAEEVADAVLFLIGNAYAHNCVLNLDGGLSATVSLL